jgi:hypothetical protein
LGNIIYRINIYTIRKTFKSFNQNIRWHKFINFL